MALPKRKVSKSQRDKRRTHQKLSAPSVTECAECGEPKLPHHVCQECGSYKGRTVLSAEEE